MISSNVHSLRQKQHCFLTKAQCFTRRERAREFWKDPESPGAEWWRGGGRRGGVRREGGGSSSGAAAVAVVQYAEINKTPPVTDRIRDICLKNRACHQVVRIPLIFLWTFNAERGSCGTAVVSETLKWYMVDQP